jgi:hypothetical protein
MIGRPFEPGNKSGKGRPPGSRNKRTVFQEILESHDIEIINKVKLEALKTPPDATILRSCFERLVPVARAPRSRFRLPPVKTPEDLAIANGAVAQAVARGRISAVEGDALSRILVNQRTIFEDGFERRLRVLENKGPDK